MRLRYPFAGAFAALVIISAYLGFSNIEIPLGDDKALHFVAFFLLTLTLYWALDLPRRFLLKLILTASLFLSVASEVVQAVLPNDRKFDPGDIVANILGSFAALALSAWYHKRMLERRRRRKLQGYGLVGAGEAEDDDVELGEASSSRQELGIVDDDDDDGGEAWDTMDADDTAIGTAEDTKADGDKSKD